MQHLSQLPSSVTVASEQRRQCVMGERGWVLLQLDLQKWGQSSGCNLPNPDLDSSALPVQFLSCSLGIREFKKMTLHDS